MKAFSLVVSLASIFLSTALCAQGDRWPAEAANTWYSRQPWLVSANYLPSDAIIQLEMFQAATWNRALNDCELSMAQAAGMNTMRVFLQDRLWQQDAPGFLARLDEFLAIAARHGIRPMLVLFDSCWDPYPKLGPQHPPIPGVHNSGWVQSPGAVELKDPAAEPRLQAYVQGIVGHFRNDPRVLAWDIWNEPDNGSGGYQKVELPNKVAYVDRLLPKAFAWARSQHPTQPLTSGVWKDNWADPKLESPTTRIQLAESDILTFHNYEWSEAFQARIRELQAYGRPILCTEHMARNVGSTFEGDLPIAKRENVGAINSGLVAGKSQTYIPWDSWQRPYVLEKPPVWQHDLFHATGEPYRTEEIGQMRRLTGRGAPAATEHPGAPSAGSHSGPTGEVLAGQTTAGQAGEQP